MKKQNEAQELASQENINKILDKNPYVEQFMIYAGKRASTPHEVGALMQSKSLAYEFDAKCQWVQHLLRASHNNISMGEAAALVNSRSDMYSDKAFKEKIFDGFMHFIVANATNPDELNSLMTSWVAQDRSLVELDSNGLTPIQTAVYVNNVIAFTALADKNVDITAIDQNGLSLLHVIVSKISNGSADISLLHQWMENNLPTDMISSEAAGVYAGKTAVECAQLLGMVDVTRVLKGDIALVARTSVAKPALTALVKAVKAGDIDKVVKLAELGVGTTTLDIYNNESYHVLSYVVSFVNDKSVEMVEALSAAKIDFSSENAEQALIHALHPIINPELADALIKAGVPTEGVLKLFAENDLLLQIECLLMKGAQATAEFDKIIAEKGLTDTVEKYKLAGTIIAEIKAEEKIMPFLIEQVIKGQSIDGLAYKGEELSKKHIDHFDIFKELYEDHPRNFVEICKNYKLDFTPRIEEHKSAPLTALLQVEKDTSYKKVVSDTRKEKIKFLIEKVLEGCLTKDLPETYKGEKFTSKDINHFKLYTILYHKSPGMLAGICKSHKIEFPPREEHKSSSVESSTSASNILAAPADKEVEEVDVAGDVSVADLAI